MKKYIFLTAEGITFQPKSESFIPDIDNLQVIGIVKGISAKSAFENLLKENAYLSKTSFNEVFAMLLQGRKKYYFSLQNKKIQPNKIRS